MQQARKNTPWREFVKEIGSRLPVVYHRVNNITSRYPKSDRIKWVVVMKDFELLVNDVSEENLSENKEAFFFDRFSILWKETRLPWMLDYLWNENCTYGDAVAWSKNVYLTYWGINWCENVLYSHLIKDNSKNIINCVMVRDSSENIYFCTWVLKGFNIFYSKFINNCSNIWFSSNLNGCSNCLFCNWLENRSYCIQNKQYTKEEYNQKTFEVLQKKGDFDTYYEELNITWKNISSPNSKGNFILFSENIQNWDLVYRVRNWRNVFLTGGEEWCTNIRDTITWGSPSCHDIYWVMWTGLFSQYIYNSVNIAGGSNIYYSYFLTNCSYCLGCIWLKNKQFCILNKQYTKEERFAKANEIFAQMDDEGTLWKFFPWSMNPFYFNDTAAYLIDDSFTKEEVEAEGYMRRDEPIKVDIPEWVQTVKNTELDQYEWFDAEWTRTINDEILKKVILDEKWNAYRVIPMELEFLRKHGLPLPRLHRLERIKLGFKFK